MGSRDVPCVFTDDHVEYVAGDTVVTWEDMDEPQLLSQVYREYETPRPGDDVLRLPDGREFQIEGWKQEAVRLRKLCEGGAAAVQRAARVIADVYGQDDPRSEATREAAFRLEHKV